MTPAMVFNSSAMPRTDPGRSKDDRKGQPNRKTVVWFPITPMLIGFGEIRSCKSIVFTVATQKCPETNQLRGQETRTHQLHMVIAIINSSGTFSHKIPMGDMCS